MRNRRPTPLVAAGVASALLSTAAIAFDADAVRSEVDGMNQSLPAMVSPVLREEPIQFTGKALMYTFTHVGRTADDVAKQNLGVTAKNYLLQRLCADADTRQMMRDGLLFSFTYVDESKAHATSATLTEADCMKKDGR